MWGHFKQPHFLAERGPLIEIHCGHETATEKIISKGAESNCFTLYFFEKSLK